MGMFDTLIFYCPNCHKVNEFQSKRGECELDFYILDNAPLTIIADINQDGKEGRLYCEHCNTQLEVPVRFTAEVRVKGEESKDNWRED